MSNYLVKRIEESIEEIDDPVDRATAGGLLVAGTLAAICFGILFFGIVIILIAGN